MRRVFFLAVLSLFLAVGIQAQTGTKITGTFKTAGKETPSSAGLKVFATIATIATYGYVEFVPYDSSGATVLAIQCGTTTYAPFPVRGYIKGDGTLIDDSGAAGVNVVPNGGCDPSGTVTRARIFLNVSTDGRIPSASTIQAKTVPDTTTADWGALPPAPITAITYLGISAIQDEAIPIATGGPLDFQGAAITCVFNVPGQKTICTVSSGAAPTGTGFVHITAGVQDGAAKLVADADVDAGAAIAQSKIANLTTDLSGKQPIDADLTAIAALATTGFAERTGANTWALATTVAETDQANTFGAGLKQTFTASASTAGINIVETGLPSSLAGGDVFIDTTSGKSRLSWYDGANAIVRVALFTADLNVNNGVAGLDGAAKIGIAQISEVASLTDLTGVANVFGTGTTAFVGTLTTPTTGDVLCINGTNIVNCTLSQEFSDATFRVTDNGDATKKFAFEVSAITTATTRTWTIPDRDLSVFGSGTKIATTSLAGDPTAGNCVKWAANGILDDQGAACAAGGGDQVEIAGTAVNATVNFLNVTATATVAGITWTYGAGAPDTASLGISAATASVAGIVTNATQTFGGAKTFDTQVTLSNGAVIGSNSFIGPASSTSSYTVRGGDTTGGNNSGTLTVRGGNTTGTGTPGSLDLYSGGSSNASPSNPGWLKISQAFIVGAGTHTSSGVATLTADYAVDDAPTSATNFLGVFQDTAIANPVRVRVSGVATVNYDAASSPSAGWYACSSATTAGKVTVQATACGNGRQVGIVLQSGASVTSGPILIQKGAPIALIEADIPTLSAAKISGTAVVQALTLTGGAGIAAIGDLSTNRTIAVDSSEADFLKSGALTCGASTQGKIQVDTTPLQYCDNAATPTLQYAAYGDSGGKATAGDSATAFFSSGILESSIGGTGNGFTKFSGPTTAEKTFTLPDASATILTSAAAVTLAQGGTNQTSWTASRCVQVNAGGTALESAAAACGAGSAITTLNTLTAAVQTFATPGTSGTAPNWSSITDAHTLNIPMAATTSVTAGLISKTQYDVFNGKPDLVAAGTNGTSLINAGDDTTAARSDHEHNVFMALSWYFPGVPIAGVQTAHAVIPEGVTGCSLTNSRMSVDTAASTSSTFNIKRCTTGAGDCTATSNIYSSAVTLNSAALSVAGGTPNTTTAAAGDAFKVDLVSVGTSLADVTVVLTYKCKNTN